MQKCQGRCRRATPLQCVRGALGIDGVPLVGPTATLLLPPPGVWSCCHEPAPLIGLVPYRKPTGGSCARSATAIFGPSLTASMWAASRPAWSEVMQMEIPVVDLTSALTGDAAARLRTGRQIDRICTEIGFFTVTGHGVPRAVIWPQPQGARVFCPADRREAEGDTGRYQDAPRLQADRLRGSELRQRQHDAAGPQGILPLRPRELAQRALFHQPRRPALFHTQYLAATAGGLA